MLFRSFPGCGRNFRFSLTNFLLWKKEKENFHCHEHFYKLQHYQCTCVYIAYLWRWNLFHVSISSNYGYDELCAQNGIILRLIGNRKKRIHTKAIYLKTSSTLNEIDWIYWIRSIQHSCYIPFNTLYSSNTVLAVQKWWRKIIVYCSNS